MAVEGMHDVTVLQLKILGSALARHNGQAESKAVSHFIQRISMYLMRGHAAMMVSRRPDDFLKLRKKATDSPASKCL